MEYIFYIVLVILFKKEILDFINYLKLEHKNDKTTYLTDKRSDDSRKGS